MAVYGYDEALNLVEVAPKTVVDGKIGHPASWVSGNKALTVSTWYQAEADGWIVISGRNVASNDNHAYVRIGISSSSYLHITIGFTSGSTGTLGGGCVIPVKKGQYYQIGQFGNSTNRVQLFVYAE